MIQCWACRAPLAADQITRDGIIRGRTEDSGGPYRIYNCPSCRKQNRIEKLTNGATYCSPAKEISLIDWLFGWIEPLAPEDFLEIQRWHHQYGDERRAVFEGDGDQRYSHSLWSRIGQWLKWIRPPDSAGSDSPDKEVPDGTEQDPAIGARHQNPSREALPHPYRILELPVNATAEQIRGRFKQLIRAHHPDKLQHADPAQVEQASRKLQHLIEAFDELKKKGEV
jgi:hypothetical protein